MKAHNAEDRRIFNNPILEALTWSNFTFHLFWYGGISAFLVIMGARLTSISFLGAFGLFISGFFIWTLVEYIMHRYVFHFVSENKFIQRFHQIFHGIHHDDPADEKRTLMPAVPGLLISSIYLGITYLIIGNLAFFFTGGLILGYLTYSSIHYAIHCFKAPRRLRWLWSHHLIHHYQQPEKAFGVSTLFWDKVFGSMPEIKERKKTAKAKA